MVNVEKMRLSRPRESGTQGQGLAWMIPAFLTAHVEQRSPTFLAPGTGFMEDNFSTDHGGGMVSGWFTRITFIVHFISIIITL